MRFFKRFRPTPLEVILNPGRDLRNMTQQELARYKAGWAEGTENWLLADMEQRRREGWSGPVKLSLGISAVALIVSIIALAKA